MKKKQIFVYIFFYFKNIYLFRLFYIAFSLLETKLKEIMADTGDEKQQKMEVDYSSTVDEKLPKCEKLAKVHNETYA